ncbi:glycosyltransferase family 4 protein [Pseudoalteromonas sp. B62]|uniref:glycosyltransferase family 4 protein n=1 Tax=Pseudoalteromonas sp. B62 TaxID=630483 RepID=UPI00301DD860
MGTAFVERKQVCVSSDTGSTTPYFLFVGTVDKRKNINVVLNAIALAKKEGLEFKLYIAGRAAWGSQELNSKIEELAIHNNVKLLGYVDDKYMQELYFNATGFLFPSIYEGFGMPVVEAMSAGCPVIASNNSAIPEAAGGAAILVNDYLSPESWLIEMKRCTNLSTNERQEIVKYGARRVEELSWSRVAEKALRVIERL